MSIMGLNIHVRVIKPIAVDRTEVTIYPIRLVGAPEAMNFGNIRLLNVTHSAASFVQTDDLESFVRAQKGLQSHHDRLGRYLARTWRRGAGPREQRDARSRDPRDGGARAIQRLARLHGTRRRDGADAQWSRAPPELEEFILGEARLLDERRFRDWMELVRRGRDLLGAGGAGSDKPVDQASLFYDDRDLMKTRIERLEHPRIHVQTPPSRTVHLVTNVMVEEAEPAKAEFLVGSALMMVEYRDDVQRLFAGRQRHRLRRHGDGFRIVQKRVDLVNCDGAFEAMAVPI